MMSCAETAERVIILVDMDCFYCQVEEKLDPNLEGKPIAVVQYNTWRGGGIIAVNYPAREKGVTRHMRGDEAKEKCPEIVLARVPEVRGKADLTKYREAGKRVADVLQMFTPLLERASVDEAYLDITEVVKERITASISEINHNKLQNTYVVGHDIQDFLYNVTNERNYSESNLKLAMGGLIAEEIRAEVYKKTGYKCSAGIAHNKILAKLVCGIHKPNKQTILPQQSVSELYKELPIRKVPGFGGKFGVTLSDQLKISKFGELVTYTEKQLMKHFEEKTAKWLYKIARGIDYEPVTPRLISKSIGCCKKFPGKSALVTLESVEHWVNELTSEMSERLEKDAMENNRKAKQMTLHFSQIVNDKDISKSRSLPLNSYDQPKMAQIGLETIKKNCAKSDGAYHITYLGFSVGNFELNKKIRNISDIFKNMRDFGLHKKVVSNTVPDQDSDLLPQNPVNENESLSMSRKNLEMISGQENSLFLKRKSPNENNISLSDQETISEKNEFDSHNGNDDNVSIYSSVTDELNEDTKSLIYYEDIYPDSVAGQPIFNKPLKVTNHLNNEFVFNELIPERDQGDLFSIRGSSSTSFFSNFFENYNTDDGCTLSVSAVERNFDTSKILREELETSEENIEIHEFIQGDGKEVQNKLQETKEALNSTETCLTCNKIILQSEFGSHMDYHYALNIVRDEAHLYKPTPSNGLSKKLPEQEQLANHSKQNTKKRIGDTNTIHTYLQTDELNGDNSELCTHCNKRIKLDDLGNHTDYHMAKKLHLEINSKSMNISNKDTLNKKSIKAKRKNDIKGAGGIISFLKRGST